MKSQEGSPTGVGRRRFWCPQVVQTSRMDCGPAAVKALLEGFSIDAAYGRLREICQTDVDGTAIGALEALLGQLGLEVEQVMEPIDHVQLQESGLPAIAVVISGSGLTHYVVAWRRLGRRIQLMDPAVGRRLVRTEDFERSLYRHQHAVDAAKWREWAGSAEFTGPLAKRLVRLGVDADSPIREAAEDPGWGSLAALDAVVRLLEVLAARGAVPRERSAETLLRSLVARAREEIEESGDSVSVPERFWSVWPRAESGELWLRGAVLLRVKGRRPPEDEREAGPVGDSMLRAIRRGDGSPWRLLLRLIERRGRELLAATTLGATLAALLVALEALLLLGLIRAADRLQGFGQLPSAILLAILFLAGLTALELAVAQGSRHLGRVLEIGVRTAFLRKIPRLGDRFFESRLRSDMAERAHSVAGLRQLPAHLVGLAASAAGLVGTTLALAFFFPDVAVLAGLLALVSVALPMAAQPMLLERAVALRTHGGALSSFYLDALRGWTAIRAQRAEASLRGEHQKVLDRWLGTALSFNLRVVMVDSVQAFVGLVLAAVMVFEHTGAHGLGGGVLLLTYWALALPALGAAFAFAVEQLPDYRSIAARFAEPIEAPEEDRSGEAIGERWEKGSRGVELRFESVGVVAGGHEILRGVDATIEPGERVAVVGASGAGKSTFLGLLLGWHRAATGRVLVDGSPLDVDLLADLRRTTAWVDPGVTLWNRSLLANLRYGAQGPGAGIEEICRAAELREVIAGLPSGMATELGEEGGRLAGGEGQRVRLARALSRRDARLVVLDEPFRGLERARRRVLLEQALRWWQGATVLCATHDLEMSELFDRVAVIHEGKLVELDTPSALRARSTSLYAGLLRGEARRRELWSSIPWRRFWMEEGHLSPGDEAGGGG